ncbi:amidase [Simiduia agarivorans]|uniref:Amidase n=1 Tax=Simiduia agarivorans (strain DSM 21679 / JCM 13881 / BCRC 17597 / SA1) TaxID=1117647 RepID=I3WB88_SIMAS|nr:amidase [Simiduia agarivorans]AFK93842.1 amidase AmiH [Simiduia agarivorans SA1 = DSM 21679]AFU98732.1 amidase [Simiduia agarivorans SA1 = DSM 21679]
MASELCYLSAHEALRQFADRSLSPVELMQALIARADEVEPAINASAFRFYEQALEQAKAAERAWAEGRARPLEGLAIAIKDETYIEGQVTTNGSRLMQDNVADVTDPVPERLLAAGGIVHARSTAPEFSSAGFTWSDLWGVTRNPWNTAITVGGSSGGSAAMLAAGTTTLANATDCGGSIRIPASMCGVVGLKAAYGRVPEMPPYNADPYVHHGVMARNIADLVLMYNQVAGPHPADITSFLPDDPFLPAEYPSLAGVKVALSLDLGFYRLEPDVRRNTLAFAERLRDLGATVDLVEIDWDERCIRTAQVHQGSLLGTLVREKYGKSEQRSLMTSYARRYLELADQVTLEDVLEADRYAQHMWTALAKVFERYAILLCPTTATTQVPANYDYAKDQMRVDGELVEPIKGWFMTYPFNTLSRCPVLSMPSGFGANGVPTGVQIVGRPYREMDVMAVGYQVEKAFGNWYAQGAWPGLQVAQKV